LLTRDKARRIAVDNRQAAGATAPNGTLVSFEVRFGGKTDMTRAQSNVRFWHKADMAIALNDVRFWGSSGLREMSAFDPKRTYK